MKEAGVAVADKVSGYTPQLTISKSVCRLRVTSLSFPCRVLLLGTSPISLTATLLLRKAGSAAISIPNTHGLETGGDCSRRGFVVSEEIVDRLNEEIPTFRSRIEKAATRLTHYNL